MTEVGNPVLRQQVRQLKEDDNPILFQYCL